MHAYLLALEVEPVEVSKAYVALPLHCTVVHWFRSEKPPAEIIRAITEIVSSTPPLEIISGKPDLFGKDKDVPVNRIEKDETILELHKTLHTALQRIGVTDVVPEWTQDGFIPHVTRQRSGRFEEGRRIVAHKLYLTEALIPDELQQKKIIAKLFLKGKA